jgi:protein SCO1/2
MRLGVVVLVLAGLAGCRKGGTAGSSSEAAKTYSMRGKVVAVDTGTGKLTVDAKAIPGFMEAMTMPYQLAEPGTASEIHVGDVITARVLVEGEPDGPQKTKLDHVVVVAQARPNTLPPVQYHVPAVGEAVPDFHLLNQSGKKIHLGQYKGKVVALTFIYTRCPQAEFCPRMSENFSKIDGELGKDKAVYGKTHLLSVSFDPAYDTPAVLRSYGGAHTGRFTEEQFAHWEFAAPSVGDLGKLEQYFDVGVTGARDPSTLMHSLSTVVIGRDGKVLAWYPSNEWKVGEVVELMRNSAGG